MSHVEEKEERGREVCWMEKWREKTETGNEEGLGERKRDGDRKTLFKRGQGERKRDREKGISLQLQQFLSF